MSNNDRRSKKFFFTKEICLGDILQFLVLACSAIWFFAHFDAKVEASFNELDDLHHNVGAMRSELDILKTHVADVLDHRA